MCADVFVCLCEMEIDIKRDAQTQNPKRKGGSKGDLIKLFKLCQIVISASNRIVMHLSTFTSFNNLFIGFRGRGEEEEEEERNSYHY